MKTLKTYRNILNSCITIVFLATIFACNSDKEEVEPDATYYIRAKINGALVEFKQQNTLLGIAGNNGLQHTAYIEGENEVQQAMTIQFFDLEPITTGTYTGLEVVEAGNFRGVNIGYIFDAGTVYATNLEGPVSSGTLYVLSDKEVKGTFSGIIRDPLTQEALTVSEGEFFVKAIK